MKRFPSLALCARLVALLFCCAVSRVQAQEAAPTTPSQDQTQKPAPPADKDAKKDADEEEGNFFLPEPSPTLAPGMKGADPNDPRAKLTPGLYDAGETSLGLEHLLRDAVPLLFLFKPYHFGSFMGAHAFQQ